MIIVIVGLSSIKAQIIIDDFNLSNSQDVTYLRVEYYSNYGLETNSITYSLWKGKLSKVKLNDQKKLYF